MVNQITLTGMILTAAPIGEYDRRVVILTREDLGIRTRCKKTEQRTDGSDEPFFFWRVYCV